MKSRFRHVPIEKLICKVSTWNPVRESPGELIDYVDISSIDRERKEIDETTTFLGIDAPSRARQLLKAHDVLVSTVRPNLNAVAYVTDDFDRATGSTGFCVLRPQPDQLDPRYLFHWVRTPYFVDQMVLQATGASYPAVTDSIVKSSTIPLPPLGEQKRLARILDVAAAVQAQRRATLTHLDTLLQSTFLHMFGDPVTNPMHWETRKLAEVGKLERGKSKHRPRNAPELLDGPYPLIQTGDIANCEAGYITEYNQTYSEIGLKQSRMWKAGVLCITIAANIAKSAILTFDSCFPDSVVGFVPNKYARTEYVQYWLSFLQKTLEEIAPAVAQKNINLKILTELDIPIPPLHLQDQFVEAVKHVYTYRQKQKAHLNQLENMFQSLQQRAFRGELSPSP